MHIARATTSREAKITKEMLVRILVIQVILQGKARWLEDYRTHTKLDTTWDLDLDDPSMIAGKYDEAVSKALKYMRTHDTYRSSVMQHVPKTLAEAQKDAKLGRKSLLRVRGGLGLERFTVAAAVLRVA